MPCNCLQPVRRVFHCVIHCVIHCGLQPVRWVGNENGHAAAPNFIASDSSMANGPGHLNGSVVAPAEVDTPFATGQSIWWWAPGQTFKSLQELKIEFDNSVGHSANLLLGLTPDYSGRLPTAHVRRYMELGDWVRRCYGARNMLAEVGAGAENRLYSKRFAALNSWNTELTSRDHAHCASYPQGSVKRAGTRPTATLTGADVVATCSFRACKFPPTAAWCCTLTARAALRPRWTGYG